MNHEEIRKMDNWSLMRLVLDKHDKLQRLQNSGAAPIELNEYAQDIKQILDFLQERGWVEPIPQNR